MILISHRGNIDGPNPEQENRPEYIVKALQQYNCEIDVWLAEGWYLGHDKPQYKVNYDFLKQDGLWIHAKNVAALERLVDDDSVNCFWHQEDRYTITSQGYVWAYPGEPTAFGSKTICVLPEWNSSSTALFGGVCSDYIERYK